ncbi:MAG: 23S rRNA (guanosine(2251)-2'-O)-methyltransferase RlmB [Gammaproteobacteria bacterium]|nr:23S rRNA (guanosine(2251)-2'-O)-methyltransferase RlmB [Gammaproteobacteria bacterium]
MSDADPTPVVGLNAVESLLKTAPRQIDQLLVAGQRRDKRVQALVTLARNQGVVIAEVSSEDLSARCGHQRHQSVLALYRGSPPRTERQLLSDLAARAEPWLVLALDEVQDPHNLGACLRSAAAAGVDAVIIPRDNAVGVTPVVQKVSAGAAAVVPLYQVTNLVRTLTALKSQGAWLYGAAGAGEETLYDVDFKSSSVIVMGSEGQGLRRRTQATCDVLYRIPMRGDVESLNVSVACGVSLFEARRQRGG